jgi:transposase-like protein
MDVAAFRAWLSGVVDLTAEQRQELDAVLSGRDGEAEVAAALDACVRDERRCPHCGTAGAVKRGRANGLRRYRCKACGKSFNALTGTPLARLRLKERWLDFTRTLSVGDTVRDSAAQCEVALTTAFRWRHRFLTAVNTTTAPLQGGQHHDRPVARHRRGR